MSTNFYILAAAVIVLAVTVTFLGRRLGQTIDTLDHARFGAYELIKSLEGDIKDLRTSLARAGIPIATEQRDELIRRAMLSPDERHQESLDQFNAVVADFERQRKERE